MMERRGGWDSQSQECDCEAGDSTLRCLQPRCMLVWTAASMNAAAALCGAQPLFVFKRMTYLAQMGTDGAPLKGLPLWSAPTRRLVQLPGLPDSEPRRGPELSHCCESTHGPNQKKTGEIDA